MNTTAKNSITGTSFKNGSGEELQGGGAKSASAFPTSLAEKDRNYLRLKVSYDRKKRIVQQNMHKAMSPISAISGYLDLMRMFLHQEAEDRMQIEQYRTKIEEGIGELSEIVEELYDTFDEPEISAAENPFSVKEISPNRRAS